MMTWFNRWMVAWNIALTLFLLASLAANAVWVQAAADPPVKISQATLDDTRGSHSEGSFIAPALEIGGESATVLAKTTVSLGNHAHTCFVTGSAEVDQAFDAHSILLFTLTQDSTNGVANKPAHRRVEFLPFAQGAPTRAEVTSIMGFDDVSGTHTFYLLGRRNEGVSAGATVSAAGIMALCVEQIPLRRQ